MDFKNSVAYCQSTSVFFTNLSYEFVIFSKLGMKFDAVRSEAIILHVCPFNSEKKRGGVALQLVIAPLHFPIINLLL